MSKNTYWKLRFYVDEFALDHAGKVLLDQKIEFRLAPSDRFKMSETIFAVRSDHASIKKLKKILGKLFAKGSDSSKFFSRLDNDNNKGSLSLETIIPLYGKTLDKPRVL